MAAAEHRDHQGSSGPGIRRPGTASPASTGAGAWGRGDSTVPEGLAPFLPLKLMPPRAGACWGALSPSAVFGQSGPPPWRPSLPPRLSRSQRSRDVYLALGIYFSPPPRPPDPHNLYIPKYVQLRWGVFKEGWAVFPFSFCGDAASN